MYVIKSLKTMALPPPFNSPYGSIERELGKTNFEDFPIPGIGLRRAAAGLDAASKLASFNADHESAISRIHEVPSFA